MTPAWYRGYSLLLGRDARRSQQIFLAEATLRGPCGRISYGWSGNPRPSVSLAAADAATQTSLAAWVVR